MQPLLHGMPLIGVPISSNDWVLHHDLQKELHILHHIRIGHEPDSSFANKAVCIDNNKQGVCLTVW